MQSFNNDPGRWWERFFNTSSLWYVLRLIGAAGSVGLLLWLGISAFQRWGFSLSSSRSQVTSAMPSATVAFVAQADTAEPTGVPVVSPQPSNTPIPTRTLFPSRTPRPTVTPRISPTPEILPTSTEGTVPTSTALPPTVTAMPPARPVEQVKGELHWTPANGPIIIKRNLAVPAGATLIIEPGTEVRFSVGASLFVDGKLLSLGRPDAPVRLVADQGGQTQQWEGIFGNPGSSITLESTEIHGAGSGGTMLVSKGGELIVRGSRLTDNGGQILVQESNLEISGSEIVRNQLPYGAALNVSSERGNPVVLKNNRIADNDHSQGVPDVLIAHPSSYTSLPLDLQGNLIAGTDTGEGDNLVLSTDGPLVGTIGCNTFMGGSLGLNLRSETKQLPGFNLAVYANVLDSHTPPIIPIYLKYGIGRGAASEVALDMHGNWWGDPAGPYEPDLNPLGRGDAVGENITYREWLTSWPDCAPRR